MEFENRFRPQVWDDLIFADMDNEAELRRYADGRSYGNILLHGPYGSGKTATAKVIAASSAGVTVDACNLDIAELKDNLDARVAVWAEGGRFGYTRWQYGSNHPYAICNEIDEFPRELQLKLRGIMDSLRIGRFIFTTNRLDQVDGGLIDRCNVYQLLVPPATAWATRAVSICAAEGLSVTTEEIVAMLDEAGGSIRATIRSLERLVLGMKGDAAA